MKLNSAFFIMRIAQSGNAGAKEIEKHWVQPEEGFETYELAEQFLFGLDTTKWLGYNWDSIAIMKLYSLKNR